MTVCLIQMIASSLTTRVGTFTFLISDDSFSATSNKSQGHASFKFFSVNSCLRLYAFLQSYVLFNRDDGVVL